MNNTIDILPPGTSVILADGRFPQSEASLSYLHKANYLIACDGAADTLLSVGIKPDAVVGDLDSLSLEAKKTFAENLHHSKDQESNDLTKAVNFAIEKGINSMVILGASGKREDHTIGNMGLMFIYSQMLNVQMMTDHGIYFSSENSLKFKAQKGQQISIFSNRYDASISSIGLRYPLNKLKLENWWMGTLNEASEEEVEVNFDKGGVLIGLMYKDDK